MKKHLLPLLMVLALVSCGGNSITFEEFYDDGINRNQQLNNDRNNDSSIRTRVEVKGRYYQDSGNQVVDYQIDCGYTYNYMRGTWVGDDYDVQKADGIKTAMQDTAYLYGVSLSRMTFSNNKLTFTGGENMSVKGSFTGTYKTLENYNVTIDCYNVEITYDNYGLPLIYKKTQTSHVNANGTISTVVHEIDLTLKFTN